MKESIYLNDDLAIINFNKAYPRSGEDFLDLINLCKFYAYVHRISEDI